MKKINLLLFGLLLQLTAQAGPEVDRLLAEYQPIQTVSCSLRRTVEGAIGKIRFISRVYYTNQDQLHVDNLSPVKRRTLADGTALFQYAEGDPKGFSRPIAQLSEPMKISLRKVPGTPMDHLLRLQPFPETELPAENGLKCIGIQADQTYAVLKFDDQNRLGELVYFKTDACTERTARYTFAEFKEVCPAVWVPFRHTAELNTAEGIITETLQVDRFTANQPVAASLFIPENFFSKNIDFVDDFSKIFTN